MDQALIHQAIEAVLPDASVHIDGEGCNLSLTVISSTFEGLTSVKRQQQVYACLSSFIQSGELHAVSMVTLTPAQAKSRQ